MHDNKPRILNKTSRVNTDSACVRRFEWCKENAIPIGIIVNQIYPIADKVSLLVNLIGEKVAGYNYYLLPTLYICTKIYIEQNKDEKEATKKIATLVAVDSVVLLTALSKTNGVVVDKITAVITEQTGLTIFVIAFAIISLQIAIYVMHLVDRSYFHASKRVTTSEYIKEVFAGEITRDVPDVETELVAPEPTTPVKKDMFDICIGDNVYSDILKLKHLLVAGATGSGKSVWLNSILTQLIQIDTKFLNLVLIDPKRVELSPYKNIPHLLTDKIVVESEDVLAVTNKLVQEMEDRYNILEEAGCRDIQSFNKKNANQVPYIIVVVDELADLVMGADKNIATSIENNLIRLAQKARACGIHLIFCTQRPDAQVIKGLLKCNMPSTVCFKVKNRVNSQIVLDRDGAENLRGNGHMIFVSDYQGEMELQGAFISDDEIDELVEQSKRFDPAPKMLNSYVKTKAVPTANTRATLVGRQDNEALEGMSNRSPFSDGGNYNTKENSHQEELNMSDIYRWAGDRENISIRSIKEEFRVGTEKATRINNLIKENQQG